MTASTTHLVLIPSYNTGRRLLSTVAEALLHWSPVWVVVDGSTDGSADALIAQAACDARLKVIVRPDNGGKGAAIETGIAEAMSAGFTHALSMDSDGQHPAALIPSFMEASQRQADAMVLGRPIFGPEAPAARRQGRKLSTAMVRLEILGPGIDDPLFGFRVYPLAALGRALASTSWARGFDFDQEVIVRMYWSGTPTVNLPAPCRYISRSDGGVSHFNYLRDNLLLVWLQIRLLAELLFWRWPQVVRVRRRQGWRRALGLVLAVGALGSALAADPVVAPDDPVWAGLFAHLAPTSDRESSFREERFFPFRTVPLTLTGTVRISPAHGLSLAYETPRREVLIVDRLGMLMRDERGRQRAAPSGGRAEAATDALVSIFHFDLGELSRRFEIRGSQSRTGAWTLTFRPRPGSAASAFAAVVVSGQGAQLGSIELIKTASEHVDIAILSTRDSVGFSRDVIARFFR